MRTRLSDFTDYNDYYWTLTVKPGSQDDPDVIIVVPDITQNNTNSTNKTTQEKEATFIDPAINDLSQLFKSLLT